MVAKKGGKQQSGNPAVRSSGGKPAAAAAPVQSDRRTRFERASTPVIMRLARLPRWVFPIALAALLVGGLMINPGWIGGLLLLVLVLVLVWLTALSWPVLSTTGRILRAVTVVAALAVAFARFTGRL